MINSNPIAVDRDGTVFMSNFTNRVRDENATNTILQFVEGIDVSTFVGQSPRGSQDGVGEQATFYGPKGIVYFNRFLFVVDALNYKIRKITADGTVSTFAGNGTKEIRDGTGTEAGFKVIRCITVDPTGNLYVADDAGTVIRKITPAGVVTTLTIDSTSLDENSEFDEIDYIAADRTGNLYFTSFGSHCIYKITGNTVSILAGNKSVAEYADGTGNEAKFNEPTGIVVGRDGNIYVADFNNHRIRKITPEGVVTTLAGDGNQRNTDGVGREASFNGPMHLAFHPLDAHADILYVVEGDDADLAIRLVDVESGFTGTLFSADDENEPEEDDLFPQTPPPQTPPPPPDYLTPNDIISKQIARGSSDAISSDDIEEGSVVGQIVGDGETIAKSSYYFPNSLNNLWSQGLSKFIDPITRKPIKNVKWYRAELVDSGGRKKTRKVKKSKRKTLRKKRNTKKSLKKKQ